jgi:hypothetical protein
MDRALNNHLQQNITYVTTTYAVLSTDTVIIASGTGYTITLYDATSVVGGQNGAPIKIIFDSTTVSDTITIVPPSGGFIQKTGGTHASITMGMKNECVELISSAASKNWLVVSRNTDTSPIAYTPTLSGLGTLAASNIVSSRSGKYMFISGTVQIGTPTASPAAISLGFNGSATTSSSPQIDTAIVGGANQLIGTYVSNTTSGAENGYLLYSPLNTHFIFFNSPTAGAGTGLTTQNGNAIFNAGIIISINARVPIDIWTI